MREMGAEWALVAGTVLSAVVVVAVAGGAVRALWSWFGSSSSTSGSVPHAQPWVPLLGNALAYKDNPAQYTLREMQRMDATEPAGGGAFWLNLAGLRTLTLARKEAARSMCFMSEKTLSERHAVADFGFAECLGPFSVFCGTSVNKKLIVRHVHDLRVREALVRFISAALETGAADARTFPMTKEERRIALAAMLDPEFDLPDDDHHHHHHHHHDVDHDVAPSPSPLAAAAPDPNAVLNVRARHVTDLFQFVRKSVLRAVIDWLAGECFLRHDPAFLDDFIGFQDRLEQAIADGAVLPHWVATRFVWKPVTQERAGLTARALKVFRQILPGLLVEGMPAERGWWLRNCATFPAADVHGTEDAGVVITPNADGSLPMPLVAELFISLLFAAHKNPSIAAAQTLTMLLERPSSALMPVVEQLMQLRSTHRAGTDCDDQRFVDYCCNGAGGSGANDGPFGPEDALSHALYETLRTTAHTIGAIRKNVTKNPVVLRAGGCSGADDSASATISVPPNAYVGAAHYLINHDTRNCDLGNTLSPLESWDPRRWADPAAASALKSGMHTFSSGPHGCPGEDTSVLMGRAVVGTLVSMFDVAPWALVHTMRDAGNGWVSEIKFRRATYLANRENGVTQTLFDEPELPRTVSEIPVVDFTRATLAQRAHPVAVLFIPREEAVAAEKQQRKDEGDEQPGATPT